MTENMRTADKSLTREQYELDHLAKKYGLHAGLAKAGRAVERETREDGDVHIGQVKKTGT